MLNILRKNAQSPFVQAIVVIIAVVFIFWGVGESLSDRRSGLATVNGKEISGQEYQKRYEQTMDRIKQQFGGQLPQSVLEGLGVKQQVLDQLIQAELLRQGAEKIGITVSEEAIQRQILEMEAFSKGGRFDEASYKAVLERNRLSPSAFEAGIRDELMLNRAITALSAFADLPDREVQDWLEYFGRELKLDLGLVRSEDYVDRVEVSQEVLAGWFEKNRDRYKSLPEIRLKYLYFPFGDDLNQVEVTDETVRRYYQEHLSTYTHAEERRARHILFKVRAEESGEKKAARKADAEKVLAMVKKGEDFARLATKFSEDSSKDKGGDLGFFPRGRMTPAFEQSVFSLNKGEVSGVVETPFGYHLIKLEEIRPGKVETLEEADPAIRTALRLQGVKAITFKKASGAYEALIRAGSLEKFGAAGTVPVKETGFFTRANPPKGNELADPALLKAAFALGKGELSSIVETASGYAILFVDDFKEAMVPQLAAVRDRVTEDYRKEKSVDLARSAAEAFLKSARETGLWPEGLAKKSTEYFKRTDGGEIPDEVRQQAFAQDGKEPFSESVITAGEVFYIFQITDSRRSEEKMTDAQRQALSQQLLAAQKNRLMMAWLAQLRQEAKIWTNPKLLQ